MMPGPEKPKRYFYLCVTLCSAPSVIEGKYEDGVGGAVELAHDMDWYIDMYSSIGVAR